VPVPGPVLNNTFGVPLNTGLKFTVVLPVAVPYSNRSPLVGGIIKPVCQSAADEEVAVKTCPVVGVPLTVTPEICVVFVDPCGP
jgi:hypothetical protein